MSANKIFTIPISSAIDETCEFRFAKIPAGEFLMGSPFTEDQRSLDAEEQCKATINQPFWMLTTPVTQQHFSAIARQTAQITPHPSSFSNLPDSLQQPVESITWNQANEFVRALQNMYSRHLPSNHVFSLPTELIWEYCCRSGYSTAYPFEAHELLDDYAWHSKNSEGRTHNVATKKANRFGLYDMLGNVSEYCLDEFVDYPKTASIEWCGYGNRYAHSLRGGGWSSDPKYGIFRSACRGEINSEEKFAFVGFRVCIVPTEIAMCWKASSV